MKIKFRYIIYVVIIIMVAVIAFFSWEERRTPDTPLQTNQASKEQIQRGEYLAKLGDCASCHTAENGAMLAGGYAMDTPFGLLYSSNLTPSADYGIGRWTSDDFYRAMTDGVAPPNRNLYPAMPYTYFTNITREDSDALYAYLMSIPAIDVAIPENELGFPFNQRMMLMGWNLLFLDKTPLPAISEGDSEAWKRGKYIVDTLGHCAMCHSPMGELGELERDKLLQGGILGSFQAPNITPKGLAERGWTKADLKTYFKEGIAPQGSAFSDMYLVIKNSTQYLSESDIDAIATYLMGDKPLAPREIATKEVAAGAPGRDLYLNMCAGCHNDDGLGKPNVAVSMIGNSTINNPDSHNLITAILEGLPWQTFPNYERFQSMPAFKNELTDEEIATLVNYLRTTYADLPGDVTSHEVKALR
ncbi:c-type cytochrome [Ignatzschineria larvae DSM 13226]|uniref:C-type cytochrome n=1 Tax=Ignatzschineria larvae DSM 13226 TaxID=1111732 RepID=A0ABZ3C0V7_9GAMM|nr:c-type cytochrome [Ignatzschineria larvae]